MKKVFLINALILLTYFSFGQEALKIQSGGSITIQTGAELILKGGLTLDNGSSLLNNGTISLKNNSVSNISKWTDNSILGALTGTGIVIFNSTHPQQFTGLTQFYTVYINTDQLSINKDLSISNLLRLIKGKINTANYIVALINSVAPSLENDATNTGYANSWINGNFSRAVATNTSNYDFPVGNSDRSNLLQFINNNIAGPSNLTASFGAKPGTDAGLNVTENGNVYTAVNNGGVWKLVPNTAATGGNYALHLYFNGFTGLSDNGFGILRRPDASTNAADWIVPTESLLEPINGTGRKVSDGFARRYNLSDFSQLGIGEFTSTTPCEISGQSQVCIGSLNNIYSAPAGMTTYFWTVTGAGFASSNTGETVNITVPNAPGTFTINLMTTLNGVPAQCSKTVTITPAPTCDIIGAGDLCGLSTNNTYSGPGNMSTYFWTASPGLQIVGPNTGSTVNLTAITPGPQLLTLNATWLSGCVSQCSKMINVNPTPPCSITGSSNVTAATTNNQYAAPENMSSYTWSVNGNGSIVGANTEATVNVTAGAAGSFTLSLTTTLNGCSMTCSKTVTVNPATTYTCDITGSSGVCNGSTQNLYTGPANMTSYSWSITGNGMMVGSSTGSSVNITAGNTGTYTLTLQTMLNGVSCTSQKIVSVNECTSACTYTQGFYGNTQGSGCYANSTTRNSSQLMLNAFGADLSKSFGSTANRRSFTLYRSDITTGAIYKMLPGGGKAKAIDLDKTIPYDGAYYSDESTWSLVPLQPNGPQKGKIRNSLLAQTITLWFNLRNSSTLGGINLLEDTLVTKATTNCGSSTLVGEEMKFGLPHEMITYLNGNNGYAATVDGLFALANDILGGANKNISTSVVQTAVDAVNNAFDGCRVLVRTIPYNIGILVKGGTLRVNTGSETNILTVIAYPNPYEKNFQLRITSPVTGMAKFEFFTLTGQKVYEMQKRVIANSTMVIPYTGPVNSSTLLYKVTIQNKLVTGIALKPN
jgi:hypothetical protein